MTTIVIYSNHEIYVRVSIMYTVDYIFMSAIAKSDPSAGLHFDVILIMMRTLN